MTAPHGRPALLVSEAAEVGGQCFLGPVLHRAVPPLAVQGPVAGERLPGYVELIDKGDLDSALEYGLINFVRVPAEAIPFIRETPIWGSAVPLPPTWVRELREIERREREGREVT